MLGFKTTMTINLELTHFSFSTWLVRSSDWQTVGCVCAAERTVVLSSDVTLIVPARRYLKHAQIWLFVW